MARRGLSGCQPGRFVQSLPLQSRYHGGITLLKPAQSTLSLPKHASWCWLHRVPRAQSRRGRARTACNTGERRLPPASRRSADAYLCHEAGACGKLPHFFPSKHGMPQTIPGCKIPPFPAVIAAVRGAHPPQREAPQATAPTLSMSTPFLPMIFVEHFNRI